MTVYVVAQIRWMESEEYRAIAADRLAASEGVVLLVEGFGPKA